MALGTYNTIIGVVLAILAAVVIDRLYQRLSHKWTNEPPLLPYRVPIIGHALMFGSNPVALFELAQCVNSVPLIALSEYDQGIILVHTFPIAGHIRSCFLANESTCVPTLLHVFNAVTGLAGLRP
jgi:hypothetical protein